MLLQQGDVLLIKIKKIPDGLKKVSKKQRGYILAEGEATGHAHVINHDIKCFEKEGIMYLKINMCVPLQHEEHKTISIPAGIWEVRRVQEYDHFLEEAKKVVD